jgi:hypothetical protein
MRLLTLILMPALLLAGTSRFARLGEFQGQVEVQLTAADPWMPAERNLPLTESARLRTAGNGRVEIEMDDGGMWRLGPNSLGVLADYTRLSTGQRITLLWLDHGTAYFTGQPAAKDVTMLAMPFAHLTVLQGSRVRETAQPTWSQAAVIEGQVRFTSPTAELEIHEGTTARMDPAKAENFSLLPEVAPDPLDRWSEDRDKAHAAPASAAYVNAAFGLADLDSGGTWTASENLGMVWKPDVAEGWTPYKNGRWRYYDALGYTWVSDDRWGWMPYHNGRWSREQKLGWVWQPDPTAAFHPAEVYWIRGVTFAGWGPLAPGERWNAPNPGAVTPQGYLSRATNYGSFLPDMRAIDGNGFPIPTPEDMKTAFFVTAPPSPAFLTQRLDAVNPPVDVRNTRVVPEVPGTMFGDAMPKVIVVTPPPEVSEVQVPVAVPVPVMEETVIVTPAARAHPAAVVKTAAVPKPAPPATGKPAATVPPRTPAREHPISTAPPEREYYHRVMLDIDPAIPDFTKALADLAEWSKAYPESSSLNDRRYYYIHVYNGLGRSADVLETAAAVVGAGVRKSYPDQQQVLQVLVAATTSLTKLKVPTHGQLTTGQKAAKELLSFLPDYFVPSRKPSNVNEAAWTLARSQLEGMATVALARTGGPSKPGAN